MSARRESDACDGALEIDREAALRQAYGEAVREWAQKRYKGGERGDALCWVVNRMRHGGAGIPFVADDEAVWAAGVLGCAVTEEALFAAYSAASARERRRAVTDVADLKGGRPRDVRAAVRKALSGRDPASGGGVIDPAEHLRPPRWWDPKSEGRPRPCTCANGPCDGGPLGCGYDPAEWDAWEAQVKEGDDVPDRH